MSEDKAPDMIKLTPARRFVVRLPLGVPFSRAEAWLERLFHEPVLLTYERQSGLGYHQTVYGVRLVRRDFIEVRRELYAAIPDAVVDYYLGAWDGGP